MADRAREYRCLASSPGEFLALTFRMLLIQPQVLLHTLALPRAFKFSLNSMASEAGMAARNKFVEQSLVMDEKLKLVIVDLRAPADDVMEEVEEKLSLLNRIKGVELLSITRVKYSDYIPVLPFNGPTPPPTRVFDPEQAPDRWSTHVS